MVRSRLDIWIPSGGAEVLLRLRNEVREGTDACVSVSREAGPRNLCFRQAYAVLSHTRLKRRPQILFIIKEHSPQGRDSPCQQVAGEGDCQGDLGRS